MVVVSIPQRCLRNFVKTMVLRALAVIYVKTCIVLKKSKQNQITSTRRMSDNVEYARRYVHGVSDGDAFNDSN